MVILIVMLVVFLPMPAYAYIDPGSGHLLVQLILGIGVGLIFHVKRLLAFLRGITRANSKQQESDQPKSKAVGE